MPKIVKLEITDPDVGLDVAPDLIEIVRAAPAIAPRFAVENQIRPLRPCRIGQCTAKGRRLSIVGTLAPPIVGVMEPLRPFVSVLKLGCKNA